MNGSRAGDILFEDLGDAGELVGVKFGFCAVQGGSDFAIEIFSSVILDVVDVWCWLLSGDERNNAEEARANASDSTAVGKLLTGCRAHGVCSVDG